MNPSNDETPSDLHLPRDLSASLLDLAPVGYLALSDKGKIAVINSAGAELLGGSQATLVGSNFAGFVVPDDADRWQLHLASVLERAEKQTCELMLARRDGASRAVRLDSKRSIQDGHAPAVHLALTDTSKLIHAEDLTSRRRAEEQTHFQAKLLSAIGQAVIATDLEGQITYMNAAAENIYGWPATAAVGRNIREVTVPEVSRSQGEEIMGQLAAGRSWSGEFAVRHRDGRVFVAEVHDTPILDSSGALVGIIGVSSDLSARKQTERSLAQSEARFVTENRKGQETTQAASKYARSLLEASLDPLVTISVDGKITDVNEASVQATGVPREILIGTDFSDYFTDPEGARAGYLETFSEGFVRDYPLAVRHTNGRITDVLYNASVYKDEQGNVLGVFAAARDVTLQKQTSRYVRSLLEASLDPLVTISPDGKITDVNEASVEATGVPRERLVGTDFSEYFTSPEQARAGYRRVFSDGFVRDYPLAVRHTNGRITDVLYNASVYKDDKGNVLGVFAAARDVTERNRLDQVLQNRNVELQHATIVAESANLAKSNFLSSMSHELRTPLNAILGFAQLIETGSPPPTPLQAKNLDQILKGGWYLLELINEILDLALIESGKATLSGEAVSLGEVLLECQTMIAPQAQGRGIELMLPLFENACFVHADRMRLKQVLLNLLSNAIKYNKVGGKVVVAVEPTSSSTGSLRLSVCDSGEGLTPGQLTQLFQPFNRLGKEAGVVEGTGIGLVVTRRLVELMGGSIGVDSAIGVGSTFWIELPLSSAPQLVAREVELAEVSRARVPPETVERSVLYVEDNPANLALVEQLVGRRPNLRFLSATSATRGIALAQAHHPNVILMDINLPGMSGLEAMGVLRADPATAHIPIIAISANANPFDIEKGRDAGFFDYLTKPIMVKLLLQTLDLALDSTKAGDSSGTRKSAHPGA